MDEQHLISDNELDPSSATANVTPKDVTAVSRRPSDLVDKQTVDDLSRRTNSHGLAYVFAHYALIGLGAWGCWTTFPGMLFWPVFIAHSVVISFLFSPLHECAHGAAFKARWLNETVLWMTALVYIVPPYYFRYFHLGHHRFTQVPGKDPSLVLPEPANLRQYLWYCAGLWFWWRNIGWTIKHALGLVHPSSAIYVPASRQGLMTLEARAMLGAYAVLAIAAIHWNFVSVLVICWLAPRFFGEPVQRVIRVAEHVGCAESSDLLRNTRTTLTNRAVNLLAWQMPYHAEHHLFPNVPFHALPRLHEFTFDKVIVETRGYFLGQLHIVRWLKQERDPARQPDTVNSPLL